MVTLFDSSSKQSAFEWRNMTEWLLARCQHALSRGAHAAVTLPWGSYQRALKRRFVTHYGVDLQDARDGSHPDDYPDLYHLFIRKLASEARPVAGQVGEAVSPVDGFWGSRGLLTDDRSLLIQAKKQYYSPLALLGGEQALPEGARGQLWPTVCEDSSPAYAYATWYLAPQHYHRVHMPLSGRLRRMVHIGGTLFPVKRAYTENIPQLFARNERVVLWFDTEEGPLIVVLVGALLVGSMHTVWHGPVYPVHKTRSSPQVTHWDYTQATGTGGMHFQKGEEIAHFAFGSTVIAFLPWKTVSSSTPSSWSETGELGTAIRQGELL